MAPSAVKHGEPQGSGGAPALGQYEKNVKKRDAISLLLLRGGARVCYHTIDYGSGEFYGKSKSRETRERPFLQAIPGLCPHQRKVSLRLRCVHGRRRRRADVLRHVEVHGRRARHSRRHSFHHHDGLQDMGRHHRPDHGLHFRQYARQMGKEKALYVLRRHPAHHRDIPSLPAG